MTRHPAHRGSIHLEDAEVLTHVAHPGEQYILRVQAPACARHARPGQFAHIQCDPLLPMRRPLSIMRAHAHEGWVEFLYKAEGHGTHLLARRQPGETISLLGPIGQGFRLRVERTRPLLIGGGVGIPPMICLAEAMRAAADGYRPLVLMGSEIPFPFSPCESGLAVPGVAPDCNAAMPLLEDWGIASRLASQQGFAGTWRGYVTELATAWLDALSDAERQEVAVYACGPHPMLAAVAQLAARYALPCQVSLEEFMACAVGGCAGCTVEIQQAGGPAMKRVCVDGPVFDAQSVVF